MYRFLDIEELLLMNLLKTELGRRIEVLNVHLTRSKCVLSDNFLFSFCIQEESAAIVRTKGTTLGFYKTLGMFAVYMVIRSPLFVGTH